MGRLFARFAVRVAAWSGHPAAVVVATLVCVLWATADRPFDWLDAVSAATLWLAVVIQGSQNAETERQHQRDAALHAKLDEVLRAIPEADDRLRGIEGEDA